jgi:hypothetical protein
VFHPGIAKVSQQRVKHNKKTDMFPGPASGDHRRLTGKENKKGEDASTSPE